MLPRCCARAPGGLAQYFPEGMDAPYLADGYVLGYSDAHVAVRTKLSGELANLASSFRESATMLRGQPGLGALADSIDGAAAVVADGSGHVATHQIHAHARALQGVLNTASRIAKSLDVVAARGMMPSDRAATRARVLELTSGTPGSQGMDALHELAVLGDDLPPELALERPPQPRWHRPLRDHLVESTDPEYAASLLAVQRAAVAELGSYARHPNLAGAVGRIDELVADAGPLSRDDTVELYGLLGRRDVARHVLLPSGVVDEVGRSLSFIDRAPSEMEQSRLDHHVALLSTVRRATTRERALEIARDALAVPRTELDGVSAGRIDGLLELAPELRPLQDRLFEPVPAVRRLLLGVGGGEPIFLRPDTDRAWVNATLDSALTGMRAEVELARAGRLDITASAAPSRLASLARGDMGAQEVLEAQYLATRLGTDVLDAAGTSNTGRVSLGLRLATAELLEFGNEIQRVPLIRTYLESAARPLAALEHAAADRPSELAAIGQLRELVERNIARIDATAPTEGYLIHPDAAEVGRASQLAQLLDRIQASRDGVAAGTDLLSW
ncbi:MAG: hypothetical protein JWL76_566 [Thermoleophilia bacterium]|nr:hypothetical protein [Thermoleophilia bacterium]